MSTQIQTEHSTEPRRARTLETKLEVVISSGGPTLDRAKRFYEGLGWRVDADFSRGDEWRALQLTPPGLAVLRHLRQGSHVSRAGLGSGNVPHRR